jgi:hypothetical protein
MVVLSLELQDLLVQQFSPFVAQRGDRNAGTNRHVTCGHGSSLSKATAKCDLSV